MTLLWIAGGLALAGSLAVLLGVVPPPHATMIIRYRHGQVRLGRGQMRAFARDQVADVLRETTVSKCFIAVTPANRVSFSRSVPTSVHQRLRNIILNQ
jgi:hypothetical protein